MSCINCGDTGWIIVERQGIRSAKRCAECFAAAKEREKVSQDRITPFTQEMAMEQTKLLCESIAFAPTTTLGRSVIAEELMSMCWSLEQATWLVRRAAQLFATWDKCGLPGLRQIFCSRYEPKDRILPVHTEAYRDGVPVERSLEPESRPPLPALPEGHKASADPELEALIRVAVRHVSHKPMPIPPTPPVGPDGNFLPVRETQEEESRFAKALEAQQTAPRNREEVPGPAPQLIKTMEELMRLVEEERASRRAG